MGEPRRWTDKRKTELILQILRQTTTVFDVARQNDLTPSEVKQELGEVVRGTIEETLNKLLDAEADERCKASCCERTPDRIDTRAGAPSSRA